MAAPRQAERGSAKAALIAVLEERFGTTMGVRLTPLERLFRTRGAVPLALAWLLFHGAAAALVIWLANDGRPPGGAHAKLVSLIAWQALHFPVLIALTRLLTTRSLDIVRRDILPYASDCYAGAVRTALAELYASPLIRFAPYAVAAVTGAASVWTIRDEIAPVWWTTQPFPLDLLFWAASTFLLAFLAMRVVMTALFPRAFAAALEEDRHSLYPVRPADSPLVRGLARLDRTLLVYWALVFLVWTSIMLLILPGKSFGLASDSPYLFILVPLAGLFSLGLGAEVYLASEAAIGATVRRYSLERAQALQQEIAALLDDPGDEASAARLERLTRLHDQIIDGGRYGSRFGKAVSIILPLTLPVIGLIERLFGGTAGP